MAPSSTSCEFCDCTGTNLSCSGQEPLECRAAKTIANILDHDPASAMRILEKLSPDRRRYLLVAATASEWYGPTKVSSEVDKADADGDQRISPNEYLSFIEQSVGAKQAIPWKTLFLVALQAGAPFVAFGFLDNSLMILSGDAIDNTFGERFALSAMGAAALGGICSGALGVQFHGFTQRMVARALPNPNTTSSFTSRSSQRLLN
eukprot:CAMPEP_0176405044 /NCGR_PEP_ID=MMETSP0127-20121128/129_1 /TAXON_ID=938130 /ORGANISM="Platyophrya macrostoma, Strain WH" /LENGTH=204 /DNA_ID=CAMNT_0017784079 /DNA_START=198 /DNA_END=809 /DNA_ORIENTATION=+